jgi:hypothetical protein
MERGSLEELRHVQADLARVERARDEAIFRAHRCGNSLRAIADETRMSHEAVRAIVARVRIWAEREDQLLAELDGAPLALSVDGMIRSERQLRRRREHLDRLLTVNPVDREGT